MTPKRTAKSCGSDAPMLASSLREDAQATVSNKPGHRGEREVSRKTIAQGRPGLLRCTCGDYARVLYLFRTRGYGCIGHPAFPAPSVLRGANGFSKPRAPRAARMRRRICSSLRGAKRRSNPLSPLSGLWIASRSLSSGAHSRDPLARNDGLKTLHSLGRRRPALDRATQYSRDGCDRIEKPRRLVETPNAYQHFPGETRPALYRSIKSCSNYRQQAATSSGPLGEGSVMKLGTAIAEIM